MRVKLIWLLIAIFASTACAQPTGNVLQRVFRIRFGGGAGTAFLVDYDGVQYFVTARHVMVSAKSEKVAVDLLGPGIKDRKPYPMTSLLGESHRRRYSLMTDDSRQRNGRPSVAQ